MMNQSTFLANQDNTELAALANAVIDGMGGWKNFTHEAVKIALRSKAGEYGIFDCYSKTIKFAQKHFTAIINSMHADAEILKPLWNESTAEMLAGWQSLESASVPEIEAVINNPENEQLKNYNMIFNILARATMQRFTSSYVRLREQGVK